MLLEVILFFKSRLHLLSDSHFLLETCILNQVLLDCFRVLSEGKC